MINQNLYPQPAFDPLKFEPIIVMAQVPNALIVNPNKVKASNVGELIEYLKKNPDKITSAPQGNGMTSHLTSELFQLMTKVKLRHIPYRGSAPPLQGLLAGDVDLKFNADGSLTLFFQNQSPGKDLEANWLPAPKGDFIAMMRMYWPNEKSPSIVDRARGSRLR